MWKNHQRSRIQLFRIVTQHGVIRVINIWITATLYVKYILLLQLCMLHSWYNATHSTTMNVVSNTRYHSAISIFKWFNFKLTLLCLLHHIYYILCFFNEINSYCYLFGMLHTCSIRHYWQAYTYNISRIAFLYFRTFKIYPYSSRLHVVTSKLFKKQQKN